MDTVTTTRLSPALLTVVERCRELRIPSAILDERGAVVESLGRGHTLSEKLMGTPLFHQSIEGLLAADRIEPIELWPGCWVLMLPILSRRRCRGYLDTAFVT